MITKPFGDYKPMATLVGIWASAKQTAALPFVVDNSVQNREATVYRPVTIPIIQLFAEQCVFVVILLWVAKLNEPKIADTSFFKMRSNALATTEEVEMPGGEDVEIAWPVIRVRVEIRRGRGMPNVDEQWDTFFPECPDDSRDAVVGTPIATTQGIECTRLHFGLGVVDCSDGLLILARKSMCACWKAKEIAQACLSIRQRVFELWHLFRGGGCTRLDLGNNMAPLTLERLDVLPSSARSRVRKT